MPTMNGLIYRVTPRLQLLSFFTWILVGGMCSSPLNLKAIHQTTIDSVINIHKASVSDSSAYYDLQQLLNYLDSSDLDNHLNFSHFIIINDIVDHIKDTNNVIQTANILDRIGVKNRNNGLYAIALSFHETALRLAQRTGNDTKEAIVLNNIGVVHRRLDNYEQALNYHLRALKIAEAKNDQKTKTIALNSLGNIQMAVGNLTEAEQLFHKSYEIELNLENQLGIAINLNNLGNVAREMGDFNKAITYYKESLQVNKTIDSEKGIAICYNDLGNIYRELGNQLKALRYHQMAFQINQKLKDKNYLAYSYIKLGEMYVDLNQNEIALQYLLPGIELSKEISSKYNMADAYNSLFKLAYNQKNYKEAVSYLQMAHQYNDSILNLNIRKEITRLQINFDSERQATQIKALQQQASISQLDMKRQKTLNFLTIGAFVMALSIVIFLLLYLRNKNKINKILIQKNKLIEKAGIELDDYAKRLLAAKKEAENNSRIKSEFLANMSHEIRTPLNSVIGFAELLYQSTKDPKHLAYLRNISLSGKNLLTLINDILDLSKIEAEKLDIQYSPLDIRVIITEITQLFSQNAIKKDLVLESTISPAFPEKIMFSDIRLRQILFNLVGNAIKFTSIGKVEIVVDGNINENQNLDIVIYVKDTGSGISKENLLHIFEPFNQSDNAGIQSGTGLGLTITKRLVEMMNGKIKVESYPDKGSIFSIHFYNIKIIAKSTEPKYNFHNKNLEIHVLFIHQENCKKNVYFDAIPETNIIKKHCINNAEETHKLLNQCNLIIVNCNKFLDKIHLSKILSSPLIDPTTKVIVIGDCDEGITPHQAITKLPCQVSLRDFSHCIMKTLDTMHPPIKTHWFFSQTIFYISNQNFIDDNKYIFNEYFLPAVNTKLITHIQTFSQKLLELAKKYHDDGIQAYCGELMTQTMDFDTAGIDILLKMYELQFISYSIQNAYNNP